MEWSLCHSPPPPHQKNAIHRDSGFISLFWATFPNLNLNPNGRVTGNGKRTGVKKMATWFAVNRSQDLYQ
jgi:hypothetical protein